MDITDFREQISNQFSAATGLEQNVCESILFESSNFDKFDLVFGEPKLDLVKSQLQFFEMAISTNDTESVALLKQMIVEAQQTIFDYAMLLFKNKKITEDEFRKRAKAFASATTNEELKKQATLKASKILGESLEFQYV